MISITPIKTEAVIKVDRSCNWKCCWTRGKSPKSAPVITILEKKVDVVFRAKRPNPITCPQELDKQSEILARIIKMNKEPKSA